MKETKKSNLHIRITHTQHTHNTRSQVCKKSEMLFYITELRNSAQPKKGSCSL